MRENVQIWFMLWLSFKKDLEECLSDKVLQNTAIVALVGTSLAEATTRFSEQIHDVLLLGLKDLQPGLVQQV